MGLTDFCIFYMFQFSTSCMYLEADTEGWYGEGGGRGGSGWGTRVLLWWIHVDVWQNQYNIVK